MWIVERIAKRVIGTRHCCVFSIDFWCFSLRSCILFAFVSICMFVSVLTPPKNYLPMHSTLAHSTSYILAWNTTHCLCVRCSLCICCCSRFGTNFRPKKQWICAKTTFYIDCHTINTPCINQKSFYIYIIFFSSSLLNVNVYGLRFFFGSFTNENITIYIYIQKGKARNRCDLWKKFHSFCFCWCLIERMYRLYVFVLVLSEVWNTKSIQYAGFPAIYLQRIYYIVLFQ